MDGWYWVLVIWLGVAWVWHDERAISYGKALAWPIEVARHFARVVGGL